MMPKNGCWSKAHLGLDVGGEVIGEQVVVTAGGDRVDQRLKEVRPPKHTLPDQAHHVLEARVRLHSTSRVLTNHLSIRGRLDHLLTGNPFIRRNIRSLAQSIHYLLGSCQL